MNNIESIQKELVRKLRNVRDQDEFVIGVISNAKSEDNFKRILEFIEQGKEVTAPNLLMLSLDLNRGGAEYYEKYWKLDDEQRNNKE